MKHFYALISLFLTTLMSFSQGYQFGLVYNSGNNFSVIAVPDFNATNTDISDIGFALMLPAGNADVTNVSAFNGRAWTVTQVTATQLTSFGLDDGTRDAFALNLPPGQTILSHTSGQQIVIVSFEISNMPTTGQLQLLANTDPIAIGLGGAINSFYNSNIDKVLRNTIKSKNAEFINVFVDPNQKIIPKLTFGSPLEDLSPQLSRQEFNENMIIKSVNRVNKLTESN